MKNNRGELFFYSVVPRGRDILGDPLIKSHNLSRMGENDKRDSLEINGYDTGVFSIKKHNDWVPTTRNNKSSENNQINNCEKCPYLFGKFYSKHKKE